MIRSSLISFFLLFSISLLGKEMAPFLTDGRPSSNYEKLITMGYVKSGDVFVMPDGNKFEVIKYIDHGSMAEVFKVKQLRVDGTSEIMALKLPRNLADDKFEMLAKFIQGRDRLEELGVRVPKVYEKGVGKSGTYVAVEFIDDHITFDELLNRLNHSEKSKQLSEAITKLQDFAKSVHLLSYVEDMHRKQLLYNLTSKEWILADFGSDVQEIEYLSYLKNRHLFSVNSLMYPGYETNKERLTGVEKNILETMEDVITSERVKTKEKILTFLKYPPPGTTASAYHSAVRKAGIYNLKFDDIKPFFELSPPPTAKELSGLHFFMGGETHRSKKFLEDFIYAIKSPETLEEFLGIEVAFGGKINNWTTTFMKKEGAYLEKKIGASRLSVLTSKNVNNLKVKAVNPFLNSCLRGILDRLKINKDLMIKKST